MDVRSLRKAARICQTELSVMCGIDRSKISHVENGYVELSAEEKAAIREAVVGEVRRQESLLRETLEAWGVSTT